MDIAVLLFDGITALDAIGPYEVLSRLPGARVRFVAVTPGPQRTDNKRLTLMADEPLGAVPRLEIVMAPGGFGTWALMTPNPLLDWIRQAHATSQWTHGARPRRAHRGRGGGTVHPARDRVRPSAAFPGGLAAHRAARDCGEGPPAHAGTC